MDRFADLVDVHHMRGEIPLALGASDGPGVLRPPLVVHDIGPVGVRFAGDRAPELQERVPLMGTGGLDAVTEAEVAGSARELGLAVGLRADEDRRFLVDADPERVLALDSVPHGIDLGGHAVLRFIADGHAVDPDVHVRAVGGFNPGW